MSLSYDGSLLDHLDAHMPLHCIIIVAPPSCSVVVPACHCLLRCLCCWHLCCASLFWMIDVFTPPSCLLPPPSPKRAFITIHPIANTSCPPPCSSFSSSRPFVVPASFCLTRCLCCWRLCHCCAHANTLVALASLPLLRWYLCHCCCGHCPCPLPPSNESLPCIPLLADCYVCCILPWWCGI
jgi:hypothetical protein